jgi:AhpC/TSA family
MKAVWEGAILAESDGTILVEGNRYFPPDSIDRNICNPAISTRPITGREEGCRILKHGRIAEFVASRDRIRTRSNAWSRQPIRSLCNLLRLPKILTCGTESLNHKTSGGLESMNLEGKKAPPFSLEGNDGEKHSLEDYKGKTVVLFFYPKDSTPG